MLHSNTLYSQLIFVLIATVAAYWPGEYHRAYCQLEYGQIGECVPISTCYSAQQDFFNHKQPTICRFEGIYPIVCCELEETTEQETYTYLPPAIENPKALLSQRKSSISEEKCQDYINAKLVTTTTTTPPPGTIYTLAFGGINASPKEFPHMAILGYGDGGEFEWQCGGSLISEDFVLTAAHCLFSQRLGDVKTVRLGDLDIASTTDIALPQDFNVSATYAHPDYVSTSHYHDIALVKLDRPVIFTDHVKPACLETEPQIPSDELLSATGWGATTYGGELHTFLQKIEIFNLPLERCLPTYGPQRQLEKGIDGNIQICGGNLEKRVDTCQGDSGGPLQRLISDSKIAYKIVGITSFGKDCGLVPGVYVKVSAYLSWIESILWPN